MKKIFKKIKEICEELFMSVFFKIGFGAAIITVLFCAVCLCYYNTAVKNADSLISQGEALAEADLSDEYYEEIASRFKNRSGETYKDYKMMEGIGLSFYGDGGIVGESSGGYTMPALLSLNFLDRYIYIMGNEGEVPEVAAARQGGVPMYAKPFTIPGETEPAEINLYNEYAQNIVPILTNNGGLNPCVIEDIEGTISVGEDGKTYFTRTEPGETTRVLRDSLVSTRAMENRRGDIVVVFFQELPEGYSPQQYVDILLKMRSHQRLLVNQKCFYVIGPVLNCDSESSKELEALLQDTFGAYFINAREYLCNEAAEKYNITIRDEEYLNDMAHGKVSGAFMNRDGNLNIYGQYAISELLTERLNENDKELLKIETEYDE
ncbi:MAG: hypothetical protein LUG66_04215 [Clostridiales bacterium]|nr:hypothetical protein [Clostridiales bacterium]